jgi:hypothetical protein
MSWRNMTPFSVSSCSHGTELLRRQSGAPNSFIIPHLLCVRYISAGGLRETETFPFFGVEGANQSTNLPHYQNNKWPSLVFLVIGGGGRESCCPQISKTISSFWGSEET